MKFVSSTKGLFHSSTGEDMGGVTCKRLYCGGGGGGDRVSGGGDGDGSGGVKVTVVGGLTQYRNVST